MWSGIPNGRVKTDVTSAMSKNLKIKILESFIPKLFKDFDSPLLLQSQTDQPILDNIKIGTRTLTCSIYHTNLASQSELSLHVNLSLTVLRFTIAHGFSTQQLQKTN